MKIYGLIDNLSGLDLLDLLLLKKRLDGIIFFKDNNNSDFVDKKVIKTRVMNFSNIDLIEVHSRDFSNQSDFVMIENCKIDLLIVLGWRRLIPQNVLDLVKIGTIGNHGSSEGITLGRGRSPQNWALILNKSEFEISIFWVSDGIDDGPEIDSRRFELNQMDDIRTSYLKCAIFVCEMICLILSDEELLNQKTGKMALKNQTNSPRYLPKRNPEDGYIDWNKSGIEIYNLVRGIKYPFPGARTIDSLGRQLVIHSGNVLDCVRLDGHCNGFVEKTLYDGSSMVCIETGYFLITGYSYLDVGVVLEEQTTLQSVSFEDNMKKIVERHYLKYPNLQLHKDFDDYTGGA